MQSIGIRALREHPGIFSQCAESGEYVLLTNRNTPVSLSIPFNDELLTSGVHVNVACKLFQDDLLTLVKASKLAKLSVESFLEHLAILGISVVDQSAVSLKADLANLD